MLLDGATIGPLRRQSPLATAEGNRLVLALLASLLAHIAVALLPAGASRPESRAPLAVRVLPPPAPPAAAEAPQPVPASAAPVPRRPAKPQPPVAPRHPEAAPAAGARVAPIELAAPRKGLVSVQSAYDEFDDDLQAEKLDDAQRRVPRSNALSRPAQPLDPIRPAYPREELEQGRKGRVLLEAFIDAAGSVESVIVVDDNGLPDLALAAANAVRRAKFEPAESADGKTRSRVTLRVDFRYE